VKLADLRGVRWPTPLLLALPLGLVFGAYVWLALEHHTWDLWRVVVHESARYTLGETIFFFRHFLREVPVDVAMGLFCGAALAGSGPLPRGHSRSAAVAGLLACGLVVLAFASASATEGWREALRDLLQFRTRDDEAAYGSHWSFHLLSTIWFGAAAPAAASLWAGFGLGVRPVGAARTLLLIAWTWTALFTVVFGVQQEVFTSARYIGHQAREILTHGLITLPLTIGLLRWAVARRTGANAVSATMERSTPSRQVLTWGIIVGIPGFLVAAFRGVDFGATAQMHSALAGVVAAHVFEHVLDMVMVGLVGLTVVGVGPALQPAP